MLASVRKTRRAVVVDEGWRSGSLAAEIMARIMEQAFYDLDAPVARVCSEEVPIPYAKHLEEAALPQPAKIVAAAQGALPMIEFKLPSLGADMDEGKLLEWKVKPGDAVKKGDVVAVVDTTKAAVEVEILAGGHGAGAPRRARHHDSGRDGPRDAPRAGRKGRGRPPAPAAPARCARPGGRASAQARVARRQEARRGTGRGSRRDRRHRARAAP